MQNNEEVPVRPGLLRVLCILSFFGSTWMIVNSSMQYLNAGTAAAIIRKSLDDQKEQIAETARNPALAEKLTNRAEQVSTPEAVKKRSVIEVLSSIFTLIGAILMFRLNRSGYWIYLLGIIVAAVFPVLAFGANLAALLIMLLPVGAGVVFSVLYGTQLRFMR